MSILSSLTTSDDVQGETDNFGMGGPLDSNTYNGVVTMAYVSKAKSGAIGVNLVMSTSAGREFKTTLWVQSGDAKGNNNYYTRDNKKVYLMDFIVFESLCLLTLGVKGSEAETEDKVIKIWDHKTGKEEPTTVPVIVDLIGKEAIFGIVKKLVSKNTLVGDSWVNTGETKEENKVTKIFRASDNKTVPEITNQAEEATAITAWLKKFEGTVKDESIKLDASATQSAAFSGAAAGAATAKPTSSIFGGA